MLEYGGLNIQFTVRNGIESNLHFDVNQAVEEVDPIWVQKAYYDRLGKIDLCVIGQVYTDHLVLMMDNNGNVYGGFDSYFSFIARSGEEAIEAICTNKVLCKPPGKPVLRY